MERDLGKSVSYGSVTWVCINDQRIYKRYVSFKVSNKCLAASSCFHNNDDHVSVFSLHQCLPQGRVTPFCSYKHLCVYIYIYLCVCGWRFLCAGKHASSCSGPPLIGWNLQWLWLHEVFTSSQNTRSHTYMNFRTQKTKIQQTEQKQKDYLFHFYLSIFLQFSYMWWGGKRFLRNGYLKTCTH